jgi:cell fate regulator YaaT (PSP1 superfamily)
MKKKKVPETKVTRSVVRRANLRDIEKLTECRELEKSTLVKARAIARQNHVKMKISDVEYQGDGRKATIYYTADDRVDFRELVRQFSHQFRIKIEMRQIGPRQETARLGGIGSCGRELCCSTWLSDFAAVNTAAARFQNLAINQQKLSGQCGRLKCCLNYELDTYMEALESFPKKADKIKTAAGLAILIKTDIFKGIMFYTYKENRGLLYPIPVAKVHELIAINRAGDLPADIHSHQLVVESKEEVFEYEDVTGAVDLKPLEKQKKRRKKPGGGSSNQRGRSANSKHKPSSGEAKTGDGKASTSGKAEEEKKEGSRSNKRRRSRSSTKNKQGEGDASDQANAEGGGGASSSKPSSPKPTSDDGQAGGSTRKKRTPRRKKTGGRPPKTD